MTGLAPMIPPGSLSSLERAHRVAADPDDHCPRLPVPNGELMTKEVWALVTSKPGSKRSDMDNELLSDNRKLAHSRAPVAAQNLAGLRGAMWAVVTLRDAAMGDEGDIGSHDAAEGLEGWLMRTWGVTHVPDELQDRDAMARRVVQGSMR